MSPPQRFLKVYLAFVCSFLVVLERALLETFPQLLGWLPSGFYANLGMVVFTMIGLLAVLPSAAWIYEVLLWKVVGFGKFDFSGVWRYENTYYDGTPKTVGYVVVKQNLYGLSMEEGISSTGNPWSARWASVCAKVSAGGKRISMGYRSERTEDGKLRKLKKYSIEELEVKEYEDFRFPMSLIRGRRPSFVESDFWNCIAKPLEELCEDGKDSNDECWSPSLGRGEMTRVSWSELKDAREKRKAKKNENRTSS